MKSDKSIRNICIASIKRHTIKPFEFSLTKIFEKELFNEVEPENKKFLKVSEDELPISQTIVDDDNWTLVTTRQIVTCKGGVLKAISPTMVVGWTWSDFKGLRKTAFTIGKLTLDGHEIREVFIETGKASMVTIYAVRTLVLQVQSKTEID